MFQLSSLLPPMISVAAFWGKKKEDIFTVAPPAIRWLVFLRLERTGDFNFVNISWQHRQLGLLVLMVVSVWLGVHNKCNFCVGVHNYYYIHSFSVGLAQYTTLGWLHIAECMISRCTVMVQTFFGAFFDVNQPLIWFAVGCCQHWHKKLKWMKS